MKRLVVILSVVLLLCFSRALAQESYVDNTRPMWGVKAALDVNIPGKWHTSDYSVSMYKPGLGGSLGVVYNIYLGHNFYLEPGVSLFYDTYSYKDLVIGMENGIQEENPSIYKAGLRIPVVAGYTFNIADSFGLSVFTGPELSYSFAGDIKVKNKELVEDTELSLFGKGGNQRRVDCAWKIGVGFPVDAWFVSVDGAIGMTDIFKSPLSFRENRITLGVTRFF